MTVKEPSKTIDFLLQKQRQVISLSKHQQLSLSFEAAMIPEMCYPAIKEIIVSTLYFMRVENCN